MDQSDSCPTYQMRVALKSLAQIADENLHCSGLPMPMERMVFSSSVTANYGEYQVSSEFLERQMKDSQVHDVTYDIEIVVPDATKDYYFDIESSYDFLTTEIEFTLFGKDLNNGKSLIALGESQWYNENQSEKSLVDNDGMTNIIERLRVNHLQDLLSEGQKLSETYILRLRFSKRMSSLIQTLKQRNLISKVACFTFDLSIRVSQSGIAEMDVYMAHSDPTQNELIRIDWSSKLKNQRFDPRQKLSVFLQFKESMKEEYKTLKFTPFAYLQLENATTITDRVYPATIRLSTVDKSSLVLTFNHNSLGLGKCYRLHLDVDVLGVAIDQNALDQMNRVCTTSCQCNPKGMARCIESTGTCQCHHPYTGPDCRQCVAGFTFDPQSSECRPTTRCKENGGEEDCNGHGKCYEDEVTGQAKCLCDEGFKDDGLDLCGRCADPLFEYPKCSSRTWIVEQSVYSCEKLPTRMPKYLYKPDGDSNRTYQNQEGFATWAGVYRLDPSHTKDKVKSSHFFTVPRDSVLRLFIDTHDSGAAIRYKILDDYKRVVFQGTEREAALDGGVHVVYIQVNQATRDPESYPYTLELEYAFEARDYTDQKCPFMEIYFVLQPLETIQNHLKCTSEELDQARKTHQFRHNFGYESQLISDKVTLTSDMRVGAVGSPYSAEDDSYYIMRYDLSVTQGGNALSVITSYSFEEVVLSLALIDKKTNNLIVSETHASVEDVDARENTFSFENDMLAFFEVPALEASEYLLEIRVLKSLFLPARNAVSCLNFDLTIEYLARSLHGNSDSYEILTVMPTTLENLSRLRKFKIQIRFDKDFSLDQLPDMDTKDGTQEALKNLFYLQGLDDSSLTVKPSQIIDQDKKTLALFFHLQDAKLPSEISRDVCFTLKLSNEALNSIRPLSINTKYCLKTQSSQSAQLKCNPNSMAKMAKDGKCVCSYPYSGSTCEQCVKGFNAILDQDKHTVCVLDLKQCSSEICNGHGQCQQLNHTSKLNDFICKCDDKYDGAFCEKCKDPRMAYPDCDTLSTLHISGQADLAYLNRKQYNSDGYQTPLADPSKLTQHKQQCLLSTYPQDLDRVEFMGMLGGEMHIADFYTVNHDQDNIIKFTPLSQGYLKILIQQPELEELRVNEETFDIEIGLYDPEDNRFLATSLNQHIDFRADKHYLNGKLDYAVLQTQIPSDKVNKTLYIMFRAVNFSVSAGDTLSECESVYIELEYREDTRKCLYYPKIQQKDYVIKVDASNPYKSSQEQERATYSIYDQNRHFFYYQDYYLGDPYPKGGSGGEPDYEIKLSVQQKFIESNMVNFLVEVLEDGIAYNDIDFRKYQLHGGVDQPQCHKLCLPTGQKSYNEFHNNVQVSANSLIRVWLYQTKTDGSCANYQFFVEANRMNPNSEVAKTLQDIVCEEMDLPTTLNTNRYLGSNAQHDWEQKDFHYLETFRVDNLKDNTAHTIDFTLKEPTLIRVVTAVHKHIEFDLMLKQLQGSQGTKTLIDSSAKNYEDSIFAQLEPGKYQLQLLFMSEEFYLMQPCQSISMEIAMGRIHTIKQQLASQSLTQRDTDIDLVSILKSEDKQLTIHRSSVIKTYSLNDQRKQQDEYNSFTEIYSKRFTIPRMRDLGVIITVKSDFLLNNVNFALTNINNNRLLLNIRKEGLMKLVADNLPGGEYELLIYAHNCLSNIERSSDSLNSMDVHFQLDINFLKWTAVDDFQSHQMYLEIQGASHAIAIESLGVREMKCHQAYQFLVDQLVPNPLSGRVDLNYEAMIPSVARYDHTMYYRPAQGQDGLRIIVDRANTKIKLLRNPSDQEPMFYSISSNAGQEQHLIAQGLRSDSNYTIMFEFGQVSNTLEFEQEPCQSFAIQIDSVNTAQECMQRRSTNALNSETQILSDNGSLDIRIAMYDTHHSQPIEVRGNVSELYVVLDYTGIFYSPLIKLVREGRLSLSSQDSRGGIRSRSAEVKPSEVDTDFKNRVTLKFTNIAHGRYYLNFTQYQKPKNCLNEFSVKVRTISGKEDELILQSSHLGSMKQYTSQEEIASINRYVQSLPISLDTYKYMLDEPYLLVSEYIQLNPEQQRDNKITFSVKGSQNSKYFMRIYVENDELIMDLKDLSKNKKLQEYKVNSIVEELSPGSYELSFEYSTATSKKKASLFKSSAHVTIMVVEQQYFETRYVAYQGPTLTQCDQNKNLPLALQRRSDLKQTENEIVYDYQYLRLRQDVLEERRILDTYKFRLNETSRFFMAFGMHMLATQVVIKVSELSDYGSSYLGKQEFNLNLIDVVLGPGDYNLQIEQPQTLNWSSFKDWSFSKQPQGKDFQMCGIFSFHGSILALSEVASGSSLSAQSKCEIKEVLPTKIYKSEGATKNGREYFINQEGSFTRVFENVLIKKNKNSQVMPSFDKIEVSVPQEAIVSILLQYKQKANNIIMRVYDSLTMTETSHEPVLRTEVESSNHMIEEQIVFKVSAGRDYYVFVYYKGERLFDHSTNEEICEYYNLYLAIETVDKMRKELTCIAPETRVGLEEKIYRFTTDIPSLIQDKDFKNGVYEFQGFTEIKYHGDYEMQGQSGYFMKAIEIESSDKFDIDTSIKFDHPYSMMEIGLFDYMKSDERVASVQNPDDFEAVTQQLPLQTVQTHVTTSTMIRQLRTTDLRPRNVYYLSISDDTSYPLMKTIASMLSMQDLCLYTQVSLRLTKQRDEKAIAAALPLITQILPQMDGHEPFHLDRSTNEIQVSLSFSTGPFKKGASTVPRQRMATKAQLVDLFTLQFLNPHSMNLEYSKRPIRIATNLMSNNYQVTLIFSIQDEKEANAPEYAMRLACDFDSLVDSKARPFKLAEEVRMPVFIIESKQSDAAKKQQETKSESQIEDIRKNLEDKRSRRNNTKNQSLDEESGKVKCLCVHGKCRDGESDCYKCDEGWTGKLCDIRKDSSNINKKDGDSWKTTQKKQVKTDGSRMSRDRDDEGPKPAEHSKSKDSIWTIESLDIERQPKRDQYNAESLHQVQRDNEDSGYIVSFMNIIRDMSIVVLGLGIVVAMAYLLLKKSKIKDYIPVSLDDQDEADRSPSRVMELTEFSRNSNDRHHNNRKRRQSQRESTDEELSTPTHQQQQQVKLRTQDFPQDIRQQLSSKHPQQHTQIEQKYHIDEETRRLTTELELYASEQQDSATMLREGDSPPRQDASQYFDTYDNQQHARSGAYHNYQSDSSYSQQNQQQWDYQHNEHDMSGTSMQQYQHYESAQPQHVNELATSHEIADVLNQMKDFEDDDDDYDDEMRRFV